MILPLTLTDDYESEKTSDVNEERKKLLTFDMFQFRINVKENIIKVNQIFAHGYGFRANIDMLQPPRPHNYFHHHRVVRRDVIETIEQLMIQ